MKALHSPLAAKYAALLIIGVLGLAKLATGQLGGQAVYRFLDLPLSATTASLGGYSPLVSTASPALAGSNPALLNSKMHHTLSLNYTAYLAGINYGFATMAHSLNASKTVAAGVQYLHYGTFQGYDATGSPQGQFTAADYALYLSYSQQLIDSTLRVGATLKPIYSKLERYTSVGLAADLALLLQTTDNWFISLLINNLGQQLTTYHQGPAEPLPLNLQLSASKKLTHAPFRFSLHIHHLNNWSMKYDWLDKESTTLLGDMETQTSPPRWEKIANELMYHLAIGTEVLLSKNIHINFGYHHQHRQEMSIDGLKGLQGFSFGLDLRFSRFGLSYGRSAMHLAGATNHMALNMYW